MRKSVSPTVAILLIVVVVLVVVFFLIKATSHKTLAIRPGVGRIDPKTGKVIQPTRRGGRRGGGGGQQRNARGSRGGGQ